MKFIIRQAIFTGLFLATGAILSRPALAGCCLSPDELSAPVKKFETVYQFSPQPFTDELWKYYRMSKKRQTALSLDRDQLPWETGELCPFPQPKP